MPDTPIHQPWRIWRPLRPILDLTAAHPWHARIGEDGDSQGHYQQSYVPSCPLCDPEVHHQRFLEAHPWVSRDPDDSEVSDA